MQQTALARVRAATGCALVGAFCLGCAPKPPCNPTDAKGCIIDDLRVVRGRGGPPGEVSEDDVKARIATTESSFFVTNFTVNLFGERGTLFFRYEKFDRLVLERDMERVERLYRARGYYEARARAGRVIRTGESTVTVEIEVSVGPPTLVEKVSVAPLEGAGALPGEPADLASAITKARSVVEAGKPFDEDQYDAAKQRIVRALTDRGYAYAKVSGEVDVALARHRASVRFFIDAGPPCTFGAVSIVGQGDLPAAPLYTAIDIQPGAPFSTEALDAAQTALGDLGVLGAVSIEIERAKEGEAPRPVVPVRFVVQRTALRAIQLGGGAELGGRVQAHLVSSWEHKNFLGGLRHFTVGARAGVLFHPYQLTSWTGQLRPLPDIRTQAELSQPGFVEAHTTGSARLEVSFYRPLTADAVPAIAQENLYENLEARAALGVDRPLWSRRLRVGTSVTVQVIDPVAVYGEKPAGFDPIILPYVELRAALDLRKGKDGKPDALNPHSGVYMGASLQGALIAPDGGTDLRLQPEVRGYIPLGGDVVLGLRAAGGLLFPFHYGERLLDPSASCAGGGAACENERARAAQILQLRGFFSGGTSSNRGYGYNGVNPQEEVKNLFSSKGALLKVPVGGRWMWNASMELRFPIYKAFGGAVFVDSSDVWNDPFAFRPHLSPGIGLRYATPIGPARLDLGVRVPCLQEVGTCEVTPESEGGPPTPLGLPVYLAIAIGEAF